MDRESPSRQVNVRMAEPLSGRSADWAGRLFQGNEAMLAREALTVYLDLRDALGFDFDRVIQPLRERELAVAS